MITTINEFKKIFEYGENLTSIYDKLSDILLKHNIVLRNHVLYINNIHIGEIRLTTHNNYIVMEMIYLNDNYQKQGYGTIIYESLLQVALQNNFKGIFSPAFDLSSGQQRSTKATNLLQKLVDKLGGYIENEIVEDEEELMYEFEDEGLPFFGPPYLNIYLTGKKNISEKKKKAKKKLSDADKEFISNKIKLLMDEGRPQKQAIAMAYSYLDKSKKNESVVNEAIEVKSSIIDVKKLEQYATALLIICGGEYGDIYFNPEKNSIFICLGDANPFSIEDLESFLTDYISKDYKTRDEIKVEADMECGPNSDEEGWLEWDGKKWKKLN